MKNIENMPKMIAISTPNDTINFMDGLALLFIGLKLGTDRLDHWTWVEVLAPLWAPIMIGWFLALVKTTFFNQNNEDEE